MTKKWEKNRDAIYKLYKEDGKTLDETRGIMKTEHHFEASYAIVFALYILVSR